MSFTYNSNLQEHGSPRCQLFLPDRLLSVYPELCCDGRAECVHACSMRVPPSRYKGLGSHRIWDCAASVEMSTKHRVLVCQRGGKGACGGVSLGPCSEGMCVKGWLVSETYCYGMFWMLEMVFKRYEGWGLKVDLTCLQCLQWATCESHWSSQASCVQKS